MGFKAVCTRQPTDWYRKEPFVRSFLDEGGDTSSARILALLASADRLRHCLEFLEPALETADFVICDRYVYSSLVYFKLRGLPQDFVAHINAGIPRPDLAILLDVPAARIYDRIFLRDGDRRKFEERSAESIRAVHQGFLDLLPLLEGIDGSGAEGEVAERIWSTLVEKQWIAKQPA